MARTSGASSAVRWLFSVVGLFTCVVLPAAAIEPPFALRESYGAGPAGAPTPCLLPTSLTGDCANLRYYNLCSSYLWIYASGPASVGVRFDGPCVTDGNSLERAITYWRNVAPGYATVDIFVEADSNNDGCPDYGLASDLEMDPGLRWNCTSLSAQCIPAGVSAVIIRAQTRGSFPTLATDGQRSETCDPNGTDHSYYYGANGQECVPWRQFSPTGRGDNFLFWLCIDSGCPTAATEKSSWGQIKGLYR